MRQLQQNPLRQVVLCGDRLLPPVYSHIVSFPRLEVPVRGVYESDIEVEGRVERVRLQPGMALFAPANSWNLPDWKPGLELLSILFRKNQLGIRLISTDRHSVTDVTSRKHSISSPVSGPIPHILAALREWTVAANTPRVARDLMAALLASVEDLLCQPVTPRVGHAHKLLEDIRVYMQEHCQYQISRETVARQFGVSPNHLSRLFQTHGGTTFSAFLTETRINRAKLLLRNYDLKLDNVAAGCGYNDTSYFCHVFKRVTRRTPREYRLRGASGGQDSRRVR